MLTQASDDSPLIYASPLFAVQSRMFIELLKDNLSHVTYSAELAGIRYTLQAHSSGILLELRGYNDKQLLLLAKILEAMIHFHIDRVRFDMIKDDVR
jgi:insulysin